MSNALLVARGHANGRIRLEGKSFNSQKLENINASGGRSGPFHHLARRQLLLAFLLDGPGWLLSA